MVSIENTFQAMVDAMQVKYSLRAPVEFGLFESDTFNAFADRAKDTYLIGLHTGTCCSFLALFNTMLSLPSIFPNIGNIGIEKAPTAPFRSIQDFFPTTTTSAHPRIPIDERRQRFAQTLCWFALMAVSLHELAHIINGHIDWKGSKNGKTAFFEFDELDDVFHGIPSVEHHALERDADSCALIWGCAIIQNNPKLFSHESLSTYRLRIWYFVFGYCMVLRAIDQRYWTIDKITGKHPPKPIRILLGLDSVRHLLVNQTCYGFSKDEALLLVETVVTSTEDAASQLIGGPPVLDGMRGALSKESGDRIKEYVECWQRLRSELMPHAWIPLTG